MEDPRYHFFEYIMSNTVLDGDSNKKITLYRCSNCGVEFKHKYDLESFSNAKKRQNVTIYCIKSLKKDKT